MCSCLNVVVTVNECKKIDDCSCSTDGGEISLRKLAETGKPRFPDIPTTAKAFTFSWNPCNSYSVGKCDDVAACFQDTYGGKYYDIAKQNTASCSLGENGECTLTYTGAGIGGKESHLTVALRCDKSQEGEVDPMSANIFSNKYATVLHSKYACPTSSSSSGSSSGLSSGSILVITFSCILIAYIIGGILINKYAKHVDGKEAFPNYSFWADFPYLIKDGCVFTFHSLGKLCGKGPCRTGYASI